jgi:hypothetical protein
MSPANNAAGLLITGQPASSWIAEVLLTSTHMAGLACPLCCRITTGGCAVCGAYLCPEHDVARRVAGDPICESCWRNNN